MASSSSSEDANPFAGMIGGEDNASIARWLVQESSWGTLNAPFEWRISPPKGQKVNKQQEATISGTIIPFAEDSGRIYMYLMGRHESEKGVSLTVSQAALNSDLFGIAGCGMTTGAVVDAQDPRCAKLTVTGTITTSVENEEDALSALFAKHPNMEEWPDGHDFQVHELQVENIWMISGFGGGGNIPLEEYFATEPAKQHDMIGADAMPEDDESNNDSFSPPSASVSKGAARARWIVHKSLWTTVSTISSSMDDNDNDNDAVIAFGNIRSIADGSDTDHSTGKPIFYLPTPDPTSKDISQNPHIVLTLSEAMIGNHDCEDDIGSLECGQVILRGKAIKVDVDDNDDVMDAFAATHPLAPWLSSGDGSHTGGDYYTIGDLEEVTLVFHFGTPKRIESEEYLQYQFPNNEDDVDDGQEESEEHSVHHPNNNHWDSIMNADNYHNEKYDRVDMIFSWFSGLFIGILASILYLMYHRRNHKYNTVGTEPQIQQQFVQEVNGMTA